MLLTADLEVKGNTVLGDGSDSTTIKGTLGVQGNTVLGDTTGDSTTITGKSCMHTLGMTMRRA